MKILIGLKTKIFIGILVLFIGTFSIAYRYNRTVQIITLVLVHNYIYPSTKFRVDGDKLYMTGLISSLTPGQLKKLIDENPEIKTIVLEHIDGSLDDASNFPMGKYVREKGLNTYLNSDSEVSSGGTDFFLSGVNRTIEEGAYLGVHSWEGMGDGDPIEAKDIPKEDPQHRANAEYINYMLGSEDFYWYTIYAAPADGMHQMTKDEILKYKVATKIIKN
ncbi:MAG: hypothetical protein WBG30_07340 [Psychrilyobacter sp.]|uniref:COG3904 family protein n=1 Tax=Psychrilyobacter sp. TaxID=2586924 RepID=UPI003C75177C